MIKIVMCVLNFAQVQVFIICVCLSSGKQYHWRAKFRIGFDLDTKLDSEVLLLFLFLCHVSWQES